MAKAVGMFVQRGVTTPNLAETTTLAHTRFGGFSFRFRFRALR
jgi:hypothetical protein